jgi:hypothetical protein
MGTASSKEKGELQGNLQTFILSLEGFLETIASRIGCHGHFPTESILRAKLEEEDKVAQVKANIVKVALELLGLISAEKLKEISLLFSVDLLKTKLCSESTFLTEKCILKMADVMVSHQPTDKNKKDFIVKTLETILSKLWKYEREKIYDKVLDSLATF